MQGTSQDERVSHPVLVVLQTDGLGFAAGLPYRSGGLQAVACSVVVGWRQRRVRGGISGLAGRGAVGGGVGGVG